MTRLAARYTVIAPDTRGTGDSGITPTMSIAAAADDVWGLTHQLGFKRVFLVGQDFGVQVVSAYAALHREDIRALAVAESPLSGFGLEELFSKYWHFGFLGSSFAPMLIANNIEGFFKAFAFGDFVYNKAAFPSSEIDAYVAAQVRPGRLEAGLSYYRALLADESFFTKSVAPPWPFPMLAMDGEHGMNGLTFASFKRVAPAVESHIIPNCGHFVQEEQPTLVADALLSFFRKAKS